MSSGIDQPATNSRNPQNGKRRQFLTYLFPIRARIRQEFASLNLGLKRQYGCHQFEIGVAVDENNIVSEGHPLQ